MPDKIDAKTFESLFQLIDLLEQGPNSTASGKFAPGGIDPAAENSSASSPSPGPLQQLAAAVATQSGALAVASPEQLARAVEALCRRQDLLSLPEDLRAVELFFFQVARRTQFLLDQGRDSWYQADPSPQLENCYRTLPAESVGRSQLLACLASVRTPASLQLFAKLIAEDPPLDERQAVLAFAPLVNNRDFSVDSIFPKLMEAIKYRHFAGLVLDLANYVTRKKYVPTHPAANRATQLTTLLGQVSQQLALVEEGQIEDNTAEEISQKVNECVALTVSLCDALALIGHQPAIGKICQALELKHRRVKTEAAAALVRLGDIEDQIGKQQLIALADEPVARIRVLSYCEELGLIDEIAPELRDAAALAESQLALWLSAPGQMGVAPTSMNVIDHRNFRWPGFEDSVDCFLIRFEYRFGTQSYSNIGIVGPATHAFACNLEHLELDDVYAAFAGWQAEHEDVYSMELSTAQVELPGPYHSHRHRLQSDFGYVEPHFLGVFFETPVLVATVSDAQSTASVEDVAEQAAATESSATKDSVNQANASWIAICDRDNTLLIPSGAAHAPITPELAFEIYKGRNLLQAFNDTVPQ